MRSRRVRHYWVTKQRTKWKYRYCVWKTSMCKWIGAVQTCVVQGSAVFDRQFLPKMRSRDNMKGDSWYWHGPCLVLTRAGRAFLIMLWSFSSVCPLTGLVLCRQARVTLKPVIRPVKDVACHPGCILCLQTAISDSTYKFMNLVEPKWTLWVVYVTCSFSKVVLIFVTVPKSGQKGLTFDERIIKLWLDLLECEYHYFLFSLPLYAQPYSHKSLLNEWIHILIQ